jgi:hypothetical protein
MNINDFQSELFDTLETRFKELGFETETVADNVPEESAQIGKALLFLLPITENDDRALTDLRFAAIDDNRYYVQIFMTIFSGLGQGYFELEKALSTLNYHAILGAYGVLPSNREFFCKYGFIVRDFDLIDGAQGFAAALLDALDIMREQITGAYDFAAALASGATPYEDSII